jgi:hypothetical protein
MNNQNFDPTQYGRMTVYNPVHSNTAEEDVLKRMTKKDRQGSFGPDG